MDILCTDKTVDLTEDKIVLETHGFLNGKIYRVWSCLSEFIFSNRIKNLIDIAIINRAEKYNFPELIANYTRIDEVPFDFRADA